MNKHTFRYFRDPYTHAVFGQEPCEICGLNIHCLEGTYFQHNEIESLCLACLRSGKGNLNVDLEEPEIKQNVIKMLQAAGKSADAVEGIINEFKKTPPVPWVQHDEWVWCCGDFTTYVGGWKEEDFKHHLSTDTYKQELLQLFDDYHRERIEIVDVFLEAIENDWVVVFAFQCETCQKYHAVWQAY